MIQPPEDRRSPLTPQLALRVAVVGTFALAMFAIIFFRLWFLQVLSGDAYARQAQVNRVRDLSIPAPRGEILDRNGNLLVDSKPATAVVLSPPDLPASGPARDALFHRLARVLGMSTRPTRCVVVGGIHRVTLRVPQIACDVARQEALLPYAEVTVAAGVPSDVLYYLKERQAEFPGVQIQQVWLRTYPLHDTAAQLFGTVGRISCNDPRSTTDCELHDAHFRGATRNDVVGQSGLEYYYDRYLRGADGKQPVQVDSLGHFTGFLPPQGPLSGHTLKLSLDLPLQKAGEAALQTAINDNYPANAGAFVAMNPVDGEVYAMGSLPTFDPNVFANPAGVPTSVYDQLNNKASNYPLLNRAIQTAGPSGSTFKPITATAALQSGAWSPGQVYDDTGQFCERGGLCRHNAGNASFGVLDIVNAIRVSSDDFFYNLGALLNSTRPNGGALQHWARLYGIGHRTGIDLGGEVPGNLPTPHWRAHVNLLETECDTATGPFRGHAKHSPGGCGIADGTNRPWSEGDNVNLAVGQGDVQVTPLQLAVAYAAIANGGTVVRPHLGLEIDAQDGTLLQRIDPPPVRHVAIDQAHLDTIRTGLHAAAQSPGGTSYDVMGTFPEPVYGKTGTAQYNNQNDYSWYACFVPPSATRTPIVVVVTIPQGGFGAAAAAPAAREILSQWFLGNPGKFIVGSSKTL